MMVLPFLVIALGLYGLYSGRRTLALTSWSAGLLIMLVLFRLHATDTLHIGL